MRRVTYSMNVSLDGFVVDADGGIDWSVPDDEILRLWNDEIRGVDVHLMGRRLYETMLYWETVDPSTLDDTEREWRELWNPLPKLVFSKTLSAVEGGAVLATESLADEIARLRAEPGDGAIAIGGATLAAQAAGLDLIDDYVVVVNPVLVGGGIPFFANDQRRTDLELVESRTFDSQVVLLRYKVKR